MSPPRDEEFVHRYTRLGELMKFEIDCLALKWFFSL